MEIQWTLVMFTAISGTGACLFAIAALQALLRKADLPSKATSIVAFVFLAVGGCASALHIVYHLDRIVEALNHPTSGIFIEAMGVAIMCVIIVIYYLALWRGAGKNVCRAIAVVGIIVGVVFAFECGNSYYMESRPAWTTHLLPLAYCTTALASGAALNVLLKSITKRKEEEISFAGLLTVVCVVLGILASAAFCVQAAGYYSTAETGAAAWTLLLFVGCIIALVCGVFSWKKPKMCGIAPSAVLLLAAFIGAVAMRVVMWLLGSQVLNFFMMPMD